MITEDYVSFETAKLLKEKGFDGKCYKVWVHYTSSTPALWAAPAFVEGETTVDRESVESEERIWNLIYRDSENKNHGYLAPTIQMAMKWLREVHNIHIAVIVAYHHVPRRYEAHIMKLENVDDFILHQQVDFATYEQACEAAIKYCLENLINNDKNDECEDNADEPLAITVEQDLGQVLMNSLCALLPYGVIVLDEPAEQRGKLWSVSHDYMVSYESDVSEELERQSIFNVRCYLRSMSSMTEEEQSEYDKLQYLGRGDLAQGVEKIDWLNAHHFDYRGLIKKGRALEAPVDMYKTE